MAAVVELRLIAVGGAASTRVDITRAQVRCVPSTSYSDLGLDAGTPHTYTVVAFDAAANTSDPSTGATASAAPAPPSSVSYAYDLADRLTGLTTPSGSTTTFTIDALGRHASQTIGTGPASSYSYLGTSQTVVAIASGSATTVSAIDAVGDRVATSAPGSFGYLLPDLHGNAAAAFNAAGTAISDAFAYDAWGVVVASVTSALPTPWRFQGRMLESAPGTSALYDFGARSYNPALGAFISLDGVHGSAQNPALLNGYLYANANPATLVDPDGHVAGCPVQYCGTTAQKAANAAADKQAWGTMQQTVAQTRQFASAQVGAVSAGCPVQYCGTSDQKEHSATLDTATRATMQYVALTKFAASAQAEAAAQASAAQAAAAQAAATKANQPCDPNPLAGNSCFGQLAGGVGNKAGDLAGGVGNWGRDTAGMIDKQMGPLTIALAAGMCIAGVIETVGAACLPLLGVTAYTAANGAVNVSNKRDFREGWSWQDAALAGVVTTAFPVGWTAVYLGFSLGGAQDIVDQEMNNPGQPIDQKHALCAAFGGGFAAVPPLKEVKGAVWSALSTIAGTNMCEGQ